MSLVAGYRALPSSRFETLALSSAAELVGVARPRCGGSVTRESDISNGENGDISIGDLHARGRLVCRRGIMELHPSRKRITEQRLRYQGRIDRLLAARHGRPREATAKGQLATKRSVRSEPSSTASATLPKNKVSPGRRDTPMTTKQ